MKFLQLILFSVLSSNLSCLVAGDDHGDEAECTHGKLYISSRNSTNVHVYDLNRSLQSMYNEKNVTLPPSATNELWLDVLSDSQLVAVLYRGTADVGYTNGVVEWIQTGFAKEDHGDHYHLVYGAPQLVTDSKFSCARPIHVTTHDGKIAIFCDGSYEFVPQINTTVWVIDEAKLGTGISAVTYTSTLLGSHHGVAIPVDDDHVFYSVATPDRINRTPNATLYATPWTFQITDYDGNVLHSISDTSNKDLYCSGYHGSVAKNDAFALACYGNHGGILIVNFLRSSETYTSRALFYPTGFVGHRSDTLISHDKSPYVIGNFAFGSANYLLAFATSDTGTLSSSSLLPLPVRQCGFEFEKSDGEYILNFMPNGTLSAFTYDKVSSWNLVAEVAVVPGMTSCGQAFFVPGHVQAFVMHYSSRTLYAIDLENVQNGVMTVVTTSLPFMPLSAVVAGAPDLYSCALKPKDIVATVAPSASPSLMPNTSPSPATAPTITEREPCGMFGVSILCFGRGECGFFRRLLNMGGC
jgi:hypothetical protein